MLRRANAMVILICASSEGFREGWVWYSRPPSHASEKPQLFSLTPSSLPKGTETRNAPQHWILQSKKKGDTRQRETHPEPEALGNSLNFLSRISNLIAHVFHQQSTRVGATAGAGAQTPTKGKKRCEILWIFFLGNVATSHTMPHIIKFAKCFYPF